MTGTRATEDVEAEAEAEGARDGRLVLAAVLVVDEADDGAAAAADAAAPVTRPSSGWARCSIDAFVILTY